MTDIAEVINKTIAIWKGPSQVTTTPQFPFCSGAQSFSYLGAGCIGIVLTGDLNVHHKKWLRFSNAKTALEELLQEIS